LSIVAIVIRERESAPLPQQVEIYYGDSRESGVDQIALTLIQADARRFIESGFAAATSRQGREVVLSNGLRGTLIGDFPARNSGLELTIDGTWVRVLAREENMLVDAAGKLANLGLARE
jgi:hypothetical protein